MTDSERLVLVLTAEVALASDGYTPLLQVQIKRAQLEKALHVMLQSATDLDAQHPDGDGDETSPMRRADITAKPAKTG